MKADEWLDDMADDLRRAPRRGANCDKPEGMRSVQLSETLVGEMARNMQRIANALRGANIQIELD